MGEVINFMEYLEAKREGMSVTQYRAAKKFLEEAMPELSLEKFGENYGDYLEHQDDGENWPEGYPYVLQDDIESGYHDECDHLVWDIVEEGYQATCSNCSLDAWSAPW